MKLTSTLPIDVPLRVITRHASIAGAPVTDTADYGTLFLRATGDEVTLEATYQLSVIQRLVPGTYSVSIRAPGCARVALGQRTVVANGTIDFGTVTVGKPGTFVATIPGLTAATSRSLAWTVLAGLDGIAATEQPEIVTPHIQADEAEPG